MFPNLPKISEEALSVTLEGPSASDVVLISPDGKTYPYRGQVVNHDITVGQDSRGIDRGGRNKMETEWPIVTLRRSVVSPPPVKGWGVMVPSEMGGTPDTFYFIERAPSGSKTHGMLTLYLTKVGQ